MTYRTRVSFQAWAVFAVTLAFVLCPLVAHADDTYDLYAPPNAYGKVQNLRAHLGKASYSVTLEPAGNSPTKVVAQVEYVDAKGKSVKREFATGEFTFEVGDFVGQPKIRLKGVLTGSAVKVTVKP
jgi:hypothetical protein